MFPNYGGGFQQFGMPSFGGMFGRPPMQDDEEEQKKKHGGFNPLMMLSPLAGMFASGHPNIGLGMISPLAGGMRALGLFK
jgi:hypothetical protein